LVDIYSENVTIDKKKTFVSYIPVYNIFLWYKEHNFTKPNPLVKESMIARLLFILIGIFTTPFFTSLVLIIIIIRVAALLGGIDIISPEVKKTLNNFFLKNPEELR
jgi:hypothetical protein